MLHLSLFRKDFFKPKKDMGKKKFFHFYLYVVSLNCLKIKIAHMYGVQRDYLMYLEEPGWTQAPFISRIPLSI